MQHRPPDDSPSISTRTPPPMISNRSPASGVSTKQRAQGEVEFIARIGTRVRPGDQSAYNRTKVNPRNADDHRKYDAIHRALLTGLLGNVGMKSADFEYTGARGTKFHIFPGSGLFR